MQDETLEVIALSLLAVATVASIAALVVAIRHANEEEEPTIVNIRNVIPFRGRRRRHPVISPGAEDITGVTYETLDLAP